MADQDSNLRYLAIFDSLPDLLFIATGQRQEYKLSEDALQDEYRRKGIPYKYSVPLHDTECEVCGKRYMEMLYDIENPRYSPYVHASFGSRFSESHVHGIRAHGGSFSEGARAILDSIDDGQYPGQA